MSLIKVRILSLLFSCLLFSTSCALFDFGAQIGPSGSSGAGAALADCDNPTTYLVYDSDRDPRNVEATRDNLNLWTVDENGSHESLTSFRISDAFDATVSSDQTKVYYWSNRLSDSGEDRLWIYDIETDEHNLMEDPSDMIDWVSVNEKIDPDSEGSELNSFLSDPDLGDINTLSPVNEFTICD